ncbi:efflux RND transporter periplasmic adaptor subunit [Desulfogranum mediterraneum]|uniref:efflux RND transporter periplasmic adaptor subunit n=1 Tax=Desulfogranum mediterraneum TaxID=160661 RepID=UPI000688FD58|nr:efflux RND transporter periplasmic adaptor subunit [Desulfogranum mediterraneum]
MSDLSARITPHPGAAAAREATVSPPSGIIRFLLRVVMPLATLVSGGLLTVYLLETGPQARHLPPEQHAVQVHTVTAHFGPSPTVIPAMGVVSPAQSIELKAELSGEVMAISEQLLPGGRFAAGEAMLRLDPREYQLALRQKKSAVAQARNDLDLEEGNQLVARRELELSGEEVSEVERSLMLRKPQLSSLETALAIARADHELARLDLERTILSAPFNGIVQERTVNVGSLVSSATTLARFIGSDRYWVEVSVPEAQLSWIAVADVRGRGGAEVRVYNPTAWGKERFRRGRVIQLLPALESQGRMARLLIEVDDPLALEAEQQGEPRLLIDSFVRVAIQGTPLASALSLPRAYLRDGDEVWLLDRDGTLDIRQVTIAYKNQDRVLVTAGVEEGEELIVSDLVAPVQGMLLSQASPPVEDPTRPAAPVPSAKVATARLALANPPDRAELAEVDQ